MKNTSYDFSPPRIIGALGDLALDPAFAHDFERLMVKLGHNAACLPFRVAPRYLKNVIACMRLMDVAGLIVHPAHARRIGKQLARIEDGAKELGFIDTVVRRGKAFTGLNAWGRALNEMAVKKRGAVIIAGRGTAASAAMRVLQAHRPKRVYALTASIADGLPRNALIFDFTNKHTRVKKTITPDVIEKEAHRIAAQLLFNAP